MKPIYKKLILVLIIAAVITLVRVTGLHMVFKFQQFRLYKDQIALIIENHYILSVLIFILCYIFVTALSIPGATVLTLACGFFFDLAGILYVNIGATSGAVIAFLISRYIAGSWIQTRYGEKLKSFNSEIEAHGYNYLLTMRFIPAFPFFLINILAGISSIPLRTFVWTTSVGIIPGSSVYIYAGTQAVALENIRDIFSFKMLAAFILLAMASLLPVIIDKLCRRKGCSFICKK